MILWLASYPKSGNTYVRSLLSAYLFSQDGDFNFGLLKNFIQFPNKVVFEKLGIDTTNTNELLKNYINSQKYINELEEKNSIKFVKTHSACASKNNYKFTDLSNSLGVIYIVRDPRNVVTSFSHHFQKSKKEATNDLISNFILSPNSPRHVFTFLGSWNFHYNSWKKFKDHHKYLLVKYEDLVENPKENLLQMLKFISKVGNIKIDIDKNKISKILETTNFKKLQDLEKKKGFKESKINRITGEKINFFNLGKDNNWKNLLDKELVEKIESSFKKEMRELNYL